MTEFSIRTDLIGKNMHIWKMWLVEISALTDLVTAQNLVKTIQSYLWKCFVFIFFELWPAQDYKLIYFTCITLPSAQSKILDFEEEVTSSYPHSPHTLTLTHFWCSYDRSPDTFPHMSTTNKQTHFSFSYHPPSSGGNK